MVSDDVMYSVEIVAYSESYFFNMELTLYGKKSRQCYVKSMFTKHQKAERKTILIIHNVYLRNFLNRTTQD